jgi:hypothetical protein
MCARPGPDPHPHRQKVDGRTSGARRYNSLVRAFTDQLGGGTLAEGDRALVEQAAMLQLRVEQITRDVIQGKPVDDDLTIKLAGASKRAILAISAKAAAQKPGGQTLQEYLANKHAAAESDDDGEDE